MNILKRVHGVILPLGLYVSGMGLFGRVKRAEVQSLRVWQRNPRLEFVSANGNSEKPRTIVRAGLSFILRIAGKANRSKIGNPVVVNDAVFVVDNHVRVLAVGIEPRKAVRSVGDAVNANGDIPSVSGSPGFVSSLGHATSVDAPSEHARLGVVVQKLFQSSLRDCIIELSHVIAPHQRCVGQGLGGVGSTLMPRSIIGGAA